MLRYKFLLVIYACLLSLVSWAQNSSHRIISTIDRGDYVFIPPTVFQPNIVGVIQQQKFLHKAANGNIPLRFSWFSVCNDGSYDVTVTPEQIYLTTGHENPNPNYLYWVIAITRQQYETIKCSIISRPPVGFINLSKEYNGSQLAYRSETALITSIPPSWSDKQYAAYCDSELSKQLAAIFCLLNAPFQTAIFKQPKDKPRLISYMRQEILDWLPQQTHNK